MRALIARLRLECVTGLIAFSLGFACHAEQLPSETDLRSAYCRPVLRSQAAALAAILDSYPSRGPELEGVVRQLQGVRDTLRRIELYLLPRIPHLDPYGLLTAQTSGEEDLARSRAHGRKCGSECPNQGDILGCMTKCFEGSPALSRLGICNRTSDWLPF